MITKQEKDKLKEKARKEYYKIDNQAWHEYFDASRGVEYEKYLQKEKPADCPKLKQLNESKK